ncbi:hypothetical protein CPB86DRAFT_873137 [Serendipita vermifera]|nr:hypothetical protein CPB86DRAFT_873137 [Serendipita vermifera]
MLTVTRLPDEIILYIIRNLCLIRECLGFLSTCRSLWSLTSCKALWMHLLECARWYRPVKLPEPIHKISVETLKDSIVNSIKLDLLLEERYTPEPARVSVLIPPSDDSSRQSESEATDPQSWVSLLEDGIHLMSMSGSGSMRLWDMHTHTVIFTIVVQGIVLCWDHLLDDSGITIIMNIGSTDGSTETFRVWRYDWSDSQPREIISRVLKGATCTNWISGEITGCVGIHKGTYLFIYVVSWKSLGEVFIDTELQTTPALFAAVSNKILVTYDDHGEVGFMACWYLQRLQELSESSMQTKKEGPFFQGSYLTERYGYGSLHNWISIPKSLWDGRIGIFSHCRINGRVRGNYVTLFTLPWEEGNCGPCTNMPSQLHIAKWIPLDGIALSPDRWELYCVGTSGKTVMWVEGATTSLSPAVYKRVCFANFPPPKRLGSQGLHVQTWDAINMSSRSEMSEAEGSMSLPSEASTNKTMQMEPENSSLEYQGIISPSMQQPTQESAPQMAGQLGPDDVNQCTRKVTNHSLPIVADQAVQEVTGHLAETRHFENAPLAALRTVLSTTRGAGLIGGSVIQLKPAPVLSQTFLPMSVDTFSVWRYNWSDLEPKEVVSKVMEERTTSVWVSKELAGCVGIHQGSNAFTYVVNWKTSCEVFIDTGIKTNSSVLVTVSPRVLIIYIDDGDFVRIACWYLNRIQELLESSMEIKREDPFFEQSYITDRQGQGSAYGWDCNIKCLWDERIGIFCSCSLDEELRGDYTVLFTIPWDESYVPYNSPSKAMSHIHIARCITGEGHLLSPEDAPLYSFGIFGKTVVWLDNPSNPPGGNPTYERMCFANFPPHRRPNPANSEEETPIFLSRTARKALLNDILNTLEDLSDQERNEFMQRNADELLHEIATQFPQVVADQDAQAAIDNVPQIAADGTVQEITEDSDEERTSETSQGAFTSTESSSMDYPADFGDICEFPVPQEWVRKYKDIYMIDFDDARGRLAFATGSGIILIVELV